MVQRPEIRQLMAKVQRYRIPDDGKVYSGVVGYNDIAIDTSRGRFTIHVDRVPGSPAWPMAVRDRREKFIDCAARALGACKAEQLLELAEQCEKLSDIRQLVRAMEVAESGAEYKSKLLSESE
jgi:2-methylcitrate dehydratase PrpD